VTWDSSVPNDAAVTNDSDAKLPWVYFLRSQSVRQEQEELSATPAQRAPTAPRGAASVVAATTSGPLLDPALVLTALVPQVGPRELLFSVLDAALLQLRKLIGYQVGLQSETLS
jgi:hypothetical protein